MSSIKFVGLHAHSLSLGDAIGYPRDHFDYVLENGGDGLAITDHGTAISYGYINQAKNDFKKKGIKFKAIWGVEAYYHPDLDEWAKVKAQKEEETEEEGSVVEVESDSKSKWADPIKRRHHLVILAKDFEGYQNLCRLITESYRKGFYRYPRMDLKSLEKHNKGLIISSACIAGIPGWSVLQSWEKGDDEVFKSLDKEFKPLLDIFGKERANIEIQFNKLPEQKLVNEYLIEYSKKTGYPLLATADSHYSRPEHWREREIYRMLAQQSKGYNIDVNNLPKAIDELKCQLYPKNGDQMFDSYCEMYDGENNPELDAAVLEAIERSYKIAHEQIEDFSPDSKMKLPKAFLKGADPNKEIRTICESSLAELSKDWPEEKVAKYKERLELEIRVIVKKDLTMYFLALREAMIKIREKLLVGAGRGSAAGSLVCYLMGITLIDPVANDLLFERFISENRAENADCDIDVEDRDVALEILREYFGENNVIAISNFNTLQLKSLVKDISKLYQIPYEEVNAVTSVMEDEARQPILDSIGNDQKLYVFDLDGAYKFSPTFKNFLDKYPKVEESIKVLFKQLKAIGKHAGGVVITENPEDNMPIIRIRGVDQTPWGEGLTAKHLEPFGFVKYDFLGIATLRVIRRCIERVLVKDGVEPTSENVKNFYMKNLHPDVINQGEEEVFKEVYHKGRFCGTFQFAENSAQEFCKNAKPLSVGEISAITAIARPGPLADNADKKYVHFTNNPEDIEYHHPIIKEVLSETKSIICYQEDFMLLAHKLANFSLAESDDLRKLLVKPITSLGEEMKKKRIEAGEKFIAGCIQNGLSEVRAKHLWEKEILSFISYGFCKCLHENENVTTYNEDQTIKQVVPIKNVKSGDFVLTRNEKDKKDVLTKIKQNHFNGKKLVYEFELDNGEKIKCTKNHKFRVKDGRMLSIEDIMNNGLDIIANFAERMEQEK